MTEMRRRMEEELELRGHSPRTRKTYVQWVRRFAEHYHRGPERLGTPEVRAFLVHLLEQKLSRSSLVQAFCALKFFYVHVLHRPYEVEDLSFPRRKRKLPVVLTCQLHNGTARMEAEPSPTSVWSFRSHCFWISPWEGSSGCGVTCTETRVAKRPQGKQPRIFATTG
ncbi:MAG TPA: site-specific integrase [Thermoanaerobaculia bacterium]|nr:site-specific integrase [Thermoanaerobaculia bacterium]